MEHQKIDRGEAQQLDLFRLLWEFLETLTRLFWIPLVLAILLGGFLGYRSWSGYVPMYESSVTFTVDMDSTSMLDISSTTSFYDKNAAQQMSKTFPYLMKSEVMQNRINAALGGTGINGSITSTCIENTSLFSIRVQSRDPQEAYRILQAVMKVYPEMAVVVIGRASMSVVAEPSVPTAPYNSRQYMPALRRGVLLGLALGLLLVLLVSVTRKTIRRSDDVEKLLNQKCLGIVPVVRMKNDQKGGDKNLSIRNPNVSTAFQESIRGLRIKVMRQREQENGRVFVVTSTVGGEGKTTVSTNLALSLSLDGARVALVDLDLRKPSVKEALGITQSSTGPGELIRDKNPYPEKHLFEVADTGLYVLAGDKASDDPHRQINSPGLEYLINRLRERYDYVILDTPPCGILADSARVARYADQVIYILGANRVDANAAMDGMQFLGASKAKLMGCILNGAGTGERYGYGYGYDHGYGYSYGYGRGYGYGYGKKRESRRSKRTKE